MNSPFYHYAVLFLVSRESFRLKVYFFDVSIATSAVSLLPFAWRVLSVPLLSACVGLGIQGESLAENVWLVFLCPTIPSPLTCESKPFPWKGTDGRGLTAAVLSSCPALRAVICFPCLSLYLPWLFHEFCSEFSKCLPSLFVSLCSVFNWMYRDDTFHKTIQVVSSVRLSKTPSAHHTASFCPCGFFCRCLQAFVKYSY